MCGVDCLWRRLGVLTLVCGRLWFGGGVGDLSGTWPGSWGAARWGADVVVPAHGHDCLTFIFTMPC